jgi:biopolymer transport protein TolR
MAKFFTTKKVGMTLSEINVIPLVDLMCNLLIIFMIVSPMLHKGITVQVPNSSVGDAVPERNYHIVTLTQDGALWFDEQQTTLEQLREPLQHISATETIYVRSDKNVPYGQVIDVITAIKESGIQSVGLVTNPVAKAKK